MKKLIYFIIITVCMTLGLGVLVFPCNFHAMLNGCFINDDYTLQSVFLNDMSKEGNRYTVSGEDAYLVFDIGEEQEMLNGKMYLGNAVDQGIDIQIFYAGNDAGFCEDDSYFTSLKKGSDYLIFELPREKIRYVRIDIIENIGYSLDVDKVTAAASDWTAYARLYASFDNLRSSFILYLGILLAWLMKKKWDVIDGFIHQHEYFTAASLISVCVTILYFKYIRGEIYYIFTDIGSDSYYQTYPYLVNTARRISNGLWKEIFNFTEGLGNANGSIILGLDNWITIFGEKSVAYLMGVSQWMKVILTGIFAYHFSRIYGNGYKLSLTAAFGYAFNAFVMIRGSWADYPNLALLLIIWLTAYEYCHRDEKEYLLPIATILFFYSIDIYYCIFWGAALSAYIAFRELSEKQQISKMCFIKLCKAEMNYWCFAILGMADTVINNLARTLQSRRFSENTDGFIEIIRNNSLADSKEILTAFLRTVGMAICGVSDYLGDGNFLEDPAFYCSILFFLLIPLALFNMQNRKRRFYIFAYFVAGIYILFPPIRYIVNGFAGFTYKISSLWIIAVMFLTVLFLFKFCFSDQMKFRRRSAVVFNITVGITILGMLLSLQSGCVARLRNWIFCLGCMIVYGVMVNLMFFGKISRKITTDILCICVVVEVLFTSWDCVNNRQVIGRADFENGMLYNNTSKNAVDDLRSVDKGWYRIEKKYGAVFLCDSLAQNYYGTMSYVGGTGIGRGVLDYYFDLELPHSGDHYLYGSGGDIYTGALLGIKYYITRSGQEPLAYGLKYLKTINDVDVYENTLALPLAYAYDKTVSYDSFEQFSGTEKRKIMLDKCVTDITKGPAGMKGPGVREERICKYEPIWKDGKYYLDIPEDHVLVIRLRTNSDGLWTMYCDNHGETIYSANYSFYAGEENTIEIYGKDFDAIWFSENDLISEITFYQQNADIYYASAKEAIARRNRNALQINNFSESCIEGQIECDQEMILATSVPYDENWHIYVDGEQVEKMKVNIGFLGAKLASGIHRVIIRYESNSWIYDNKFKCVGFVFAILFIVMQVVKKKKGKL